MESKGCYPRRGGDRERELVTVMEVFVGHDWSETHHDVFVSDGDGNELAVARLGAGIEGVARFYELVAPFVDDPSEVYVGSETDQGLWIGSLIGAGYRVFAINPKAVALHREARVLSGAKSDPSDARLLADIVRVDHSRLRPVAGDTDQARAVKVLARQHQNLIWDRTRYHNMVRAGLLEYYPQALKAFSDWSLSDPHVVAVLQAAPTPEAGQRITKTQIIAALKRGGRQRRLDTAAATIQHQLRQPQITAPAHVVAARAHVVVAYLAVLETLNTQINRLARELEQLFNQHPDAEILLSLPGMGTVIGARALAEFGDDPNRFVDAKARKNATGTSPVTRQSGKQRTVTARGRIGNTRARSNAEQWAFCSLNSSPGARSFYDHQITLGRSHNQAIRALANRLVGIVHGCLTTRTLYNEHTAWGHRHQQTNKAA